MAPPETTGNEHPNDDLLLAFHDNVLFSGDRPLVEGHLKDCPRCRARLIALTEDITPTVPTPATQTPPAAPPPRASSNAPTRARNGVKTIAAVAVIIGILAGATIFIQRELRRRSAEPVSLASTPSTPEPASVPTITGIPEPPAPPAEEPVTEPSAGEPAEPTAAAIVASEPIVLISPNRNFRWRVVGLDVERSTDGGTEWIKQEVMLSKPITAGAAPSAAVCWLVGRGGLVVTALGTQWRDVSMKQPIDLVRIAALDSMNATVTAMDGRQFSTSDAGRSWIPLGP